MAWTITFGGGGGWKKYQGVSIYSEGRANDVCWQNGCGACESWRWPSILAWATRGIELPLTKLGETEGVALWGGMIRNALVGLFHLRCLLDIKETGPGGIWRYKCGVCRQVEVANKKLSSVSILAICGVMKLDESTKGRGAGDRGKKRTNG